MRLIIAGGRDFMDEDLMVTTLNTLISDGSLPPETEWEIVTGMARGADLLGFRLAEANDIPVIKFPANWKQYGRRAGMVRNAKMAYFADILVAFWDGKSTGTRNMIDAMALRNKPFYVVRY